MKVIEQYFQVLSVHVLALDNFAKSNSILSFELDSLGSERVKWGWIELTKKKAG